MVPSWAIIEIRGIFELWLFPHVVAGMLVPMLTYASMYRLQFTWRQGLCLALLIVLPIRITWDAWQLADWRKPDALAEIMSHWWNASRGSIGVVFAVSAAITYFYWRRRFRKLCLPDAQFQEAKP